MKAAAPSRGLVMARAQGAFCIASGVWPLLHRRSFEAVFGPKRDYWLAATVGLFLVGNGTVQLTTPATASGVAAARRLGVATAVTLASSDLVNVARGRISRM